MDLIRRILLACEECPSGFCPSPHEIQVEGHTEEEIGYHCWLAWQGGLLDGDDGSTSDSRSPEVILNALTWAGHEFLEASRDPTRWQKAKAVVAKLGGASMGVLTGILTDLAKKTAAGFM